MTGRVIGILLLASGLIAGAAMYWLQVYGYYRELAPGEVTLTLTRLDGTAEPLAAEDLTAIDAESSPIRFRACFTLAEPGGLATAALPAPEAVPLNAPGWFDCFDAARIGADLEAGRAVAVVGARNVIYGIDRILALYPDGRGYAWHQINACGKEVFDGKPPPPGCPPPS